ncbi:MAG: energy-coupled thiamine transporter ThiT [Oscillospiraceae bacterium]|jgi:thiamine transporter|nr:energy-coupled thiamine transporter ThiT [Oscillospiraceae bacterium]
MNSQTKTSGMNPTVLRLVESAVMLGLATALSMVKLYQMPLGGSVTLCSMLPILLVAYHYGPKWGLLTGFTYGVIQLLLDVSAVLSWGLTPTAVAVSFLLDYLAAFSSLGLAGIYGKGFKRYMGGMLTAVALRYLCHVIAGATAYASFLPESWHSGLWFYSLAYNAFLLPDFAICAVVGALVYKPLKKFLEP